jgi:hypothetical protein
LGFNQGSPFFSRTLREISSNKREERKTGRKQWEHSIETMTKVDTGDQKKRQRKKEQSKKAKRGENAQMKRQRRASFLFIYSNIRSSFWNEKIDKDHWKKRRRRKRLHRQNQKRIQVRETWADVWMRNALVGDRIIQKVLGAFRITHHFAHADQAKKQGEQASNHFQFSTRWETEEVLDVFLL